MTEEQVSTLIGICPGCQRIVFASVIDKDPARTKDQAREVSKLIKAGVRIETWDDIVKVRQGPWTCSCNKSGRGAAA